MTRDSKEYLTLIHDTKRIWYFTTATFAVGVIITLFGMQLFSMVLQQFGQIFLPQIGFLAFVFGSSFWMLNIAFRLTVTVWAANQLRENNLLEPSFQTWMEWTNLIFSIYMVLAYFAVGCMGYSLHQLTILPLWTSWMCIVFGFGGSILYLCRVPFFEPSMMIHIPLLIIGIIILSKINA